MARSQVAAEQGSLLSFAIDEAHCICDWGPDFRPAYLGLRTLKSDFPTVPLAAFTVSLRPDLGLCMMVTANQQLSGVICLLLYYSRRNN
jgi:superfamily II DNA helicase RecQ